MSRLYCHDCNEEVEYELKTGSFPIEVRGKSITVEGTRAFCVNCESELFHPKFDMENQEKAFAQYRTLEGILSPEEIRMIRTGYNLNQREFSRLLGFGEITISRYERGSLPTPAQNHIIKESANPAKMRELLELNSQKVPEEVVVRLQRDLNTAVVLEEQIIREIRDIFHDNPDIYRGNVSFSPMKLTQMILFFARNVNQNLYVTKLNKLLFYADFYHFLRKGSSISGTRYLCDHYGPVPEKFNTLYDNMKEIELMENEYGQFILPTSAFDHRFFTPEEQETMAMVLEKFEKTTSSEISELSHQEMAWIRTPRKEYISYDFAKEMRMDTD
ncbi:type II TA system antitoxin MqsA family protein [Risungbinella massiliensis]|uniref:type II TA system antitoxin MqsA family protein n=1 Tax=Risungbinella massiliensis TaxID=1329796 RepID=UPI0005CC20C7|nr:type II TA system antitoxin MqsA family protein [Risungbinella massiliensis]